MSRHIDAGIFQRPPENGRQQRSLSLAAIARRRQRGSVSLLLCLVTTPLILILSTFLMGVRIQDAELDVDRALSAMVQTRLSGFDKSLYEEFGLLSLTAGDRSATFKNMIPDSMQTLQVRQALDQPLSEPPVLKNSILTYMRLRLPASLIKTIADQTGVNITAPKKKTSFASPTGTLTTRLAMTTQQRPGLDGARWSGQSIQLLPGTSGSAADSIQRMGLITSMIPDTLLDEFTGKVQSVVWNLFSKAIYEFLDDEVKEALGHYQRFVAECASGADDQQLVSYPDIFNPSQISNFTDIISQALTVPNLELFNFMGVREYVLGSFWPAGQPSQAITASFAGIRLSGDHLVHHNLSGVPFKQYPGREPGEVEQVLTGAKSAKSGISQVKAILVMYRTALYLFHQLSQADGMLPYRLTSTGVCGLVGVISGGTIVIDPEIMAYILLACDSLRQGFTDYAKLMKGDRLAFTAVKGNGALALDYVMHLRVLLFLTPEKKLLPRIWTTINKRHAGVKNTRIVAVCEFRGRDRVQQGSLLTIGAAS